MYYITIVVYILSFNNIYMYVADYNITLYNIKKYVCGTVVWNEILLLLKIMIFLECYTGLMINCSFQKEKDFIN